MSWCQAWSTSCRYSDYRVGLFYFAPTLNMFALLITTLPSSKNTRVGDNWRKRYDFLVLHGMRCYFCTCTRAANFDYRSRLVRPPAIHPLPFKLARLVCLTLHIIFTRKLIPHSVRLRTSLAIGSKHMWALHRIYHDSLIIAAQAASMELNIWLRSTIVSSSYNEDKHEWTVEISREGLPNRTLKPKVCIYHALI